MATQRLSFIECRALEEFQAMYPEKCRDPKRPMSEAAFMASFRAHLARAREIVVGEIRFGDIFDAALAAPIAPPRKVRLTARPEPASERDADLTDYGEDVGRAIEAAALGYKRWCAERQAAEIARAFTREQRAMVKATAIVVGAENDVQGDLRETAKSLIARASQDKAARVRQIMAALGLVESASKPALEPLVRWLLRVSSNTRYETAVGLALIEGGLITANVAEQIMAA